ncbi:unnamed protein product [Psylliodes chrysocephalus]|uniref:Mutator-like transposase domain-containing protein n=1 Tax=Psylliodes chrysocephalus TaxID=3402493 RepID=A0A9P0GAS5_9CUCU|nr:unnamed protein product [Psylliodes chrysocephala]
MHFKFKTSHDTQDNVNKDAVIGVTSISSAFDHLEQISDSLDIPCMSQRLYIKVHDKISDALEETSTQTMKDAAEEERRLAIAEVKFVQAIMSNFDRNGRMVIRNLIVRCIQCNSEPYTANVLSDFNIDPHRKSNKANVFCSDELFLGRS